MNEEDIVVKRFVNDKCFKVPDGYFEGLSEKIMSNIPDTNANRGFNIHKILKPVLYAACIVFAVFCISNLFDKNNDKIDEASIAQSDAYSEAIMDYAMMDNLDIYSCLASEYN